MIFPYEKKVWRNRMQPTNGRQTEDEKAQIKKWCKFTSGIKAKRRKTRAYIVRVIKSRKMRRAMFKYEELTKAREIFDLVLKPGELRTSGRHRRRGE
jgi:hypothetical protein